MAEVRVLEAAELARFLDEYDLATGAPGRLMTYRYLGTSSRPADRHHAEGTMALRHDLRSPAGPRAAALVVLYAEVIGSLSDAIAVVAPTQFDLTVLDDCRGVEVVRCLGELVHEGRTAIFGKARFVDAADPERVLAVCRDSEAVSGPAPDDRVAPVSVPIDFDPPARPPLWQAFGVEEREDGTLAVPALTPRLGARSGAMHHGPTQVLLEEAALRAARVELPSAGTQFRLRHWHLTLNARAKDGPFVASTQVIGVGGAAIAVDADLRDEASGRVVASATATFDVLST